MKNKKLTPEGLLTRTIREFLTLNKVFHWKAWQGMMSVQGVPDIIGCIEGRLLAIEVKAPKGKVSDKQAEFLNRIACSGGIVIIARSLEDVVEGLHKAGITKFRFMPTLL